MERKMGAKLDRCIAKLRLTLPMLGNLEGGQGCLEELQKDIKEIKETLKEEILRVLHDCPPAQEFGQSVIKRYGWEQLWFRSLSFWFLFYLAWLWLKFGYKPESADLERLFKSWVYGSFGYRLIDLFFDESGVDQQEAVIGLWLISEHEFEVLQLFEASPNAVVHVRKAKTEWFRAEVQEKRLRGKRCPYSDPLNCAEKAAPIFAFFSLALLRYGKSREIPLYRDLVYKLIAVTQLLDDLSDLEDDLSHGFFTIPCSGLEECLSQLSPAEGAELIRHDGERMKDLYILCSNFLESASQLAQQVADPLFEALAQHKLWLITKIFYGEEESDEEQGGR